MKTKKIAHLPLTIKRNDDGFLANCPLIQGLSLKVIPSR